MVLRARQAEGSDFYVTLGVAWKIQVNGADAYSVKLQNIPLGWDGSCLMMPPKNED
jgi:hypothetical protein